MPDGVAPVVSDRQSLHHIHAGDTFGLIYVEVMGGVRFLQPVIGMQLVDVKNRTDETYPNQQHHDFANSAGSIFSHRLTVMIDEHQLGLKIQPVQQ